MSKRALLIGINGFSPEDVRSNIPKLEGCVNDAELMADHLTKDFGFPALQVRVLRNEKAKGKDIRRELGWLFSEYDNDGSDVRFLHISTHGTQVKVESDDAHEVDNLDEAFVVYDHAWGDPFRDNEIRAFFAKVPENVTVIFQADCCHSGDIKSLVSGGPPSLDPAPWPDDLVEGSDSEPRRLVNPNASVQHHELKTKAFKIVKSKTRSGSDPAEPFPPHILISACADFQESKEFETSSTGRFGGRHHGGLTYAVSKTIEEFKSKSGGKLTKLTYKKLIRTVGNHLRFSMQTPQLECPQDLLGTPVFTPAKGRGIGAPVIDKPNEGDQSEMSDQDPTTSDELIRFLMIATARGYKKDKKLKAVMKEGGLHPMIREAMLTREHDAISLALSNFSKPIPDEGGGG